MRKYEGVQPSRGPPCGHSHRSPIPPPRQPWHAALMSVRVCVCVRVCVHACVQCGVWCPAAVTLQTWASGSPDWDQAWRRGQLVSLNSAITDGPLEASQPAGQGCTCFFSQRVWASGWLDPASSSPPLKHQLETSAQRMLGR